MIRATMGFIGAGNMAEALLRGILEAKVCPPENIWLADINEIRLAHIAKTYNVSVCSHNNDLLQRAAVVVLAVKPQQVKDVMRELRAKWDPSRHVMLSIAAGVSTPILEKMSGCALKVVRIMPNTPARFKVGAAAFCLGQYAGEAETLLVHRLFEAVGIVVRVEEKLMNAVTALSGSGPAYVFKLCEMMTAAGIALGLPQPTAEQLARQTILGAATMLHMSGQSASELRHAVTSPGGTTEAALAWLQQSDFEDVFLQALRAARDRGAELTPTHREG